MLSSRMSSITAHMARATRTTKCNSLISQTVKDISVRSVPTITSHYAFTTYSNNNNTLYSSSSMAPLKQKNYNFSTATTQEAVAPNHGKLDHDTLSKIKKELIEADVNNDGRIDSQELKAILKKHSNAFSDRDVVKLGELFYVAKAGGSISHGEFLDRVAYLAMPPDEKDGDDGGTTTITAERSGHGLTHRRAEIDKKHPLGLGNCGVEYLGGNRPVYTAEELDIKFTHVEPQTMADKLAYGGVRVVRFCFDTVSLWKFGEITQAKVYRRVIFLETVAAIPGFIAAMVRHFRSLRAFSRDGGMLQMFLDEANNERMHLLTFVRMKNPSYLTRGLVLVSQTFIGAAFFIAYNISPALCHRFVGYIEEEACHTYTDIIKCVEEAPEDNEMAQWRTELAPAIARGYWNLGENGTVLDMLYAVRADEAEHRDVNHTCAGLKEGQMIPLFNPQDEFDKMLQKYAADIMTKDNAK